MEYGGSHAVFLYYVELFYYLGFFKLSDRKLRAYLKICNFSIREVFPWVRSHM